MHQMPINIDQARAVFLVMHNMISPDFFKQRAGFCGHSDRQDTALSVLFKGLCVSAQEKTCCAAINCVILIKMSGLIECDVVRKQLKLSGQNNGTKLERRL